MDDPRYHKPTEEQFKQTGPDHFRTCACGEPAGLVTSDGRAYCGACLRTRKEKE
jgi:hypothetical protein